MATATKTWDISLKYLETTDTKTVLDNYMIHYLAEKSSEAQNEILQIHYSYFYQAYRVSWGVKKLQYKEMLYRLNFYLDPFKMDGQYSVRSTSRFPTLRIKKLTTKQASLHYNYVPGDTVICDHDTFWRRYDYNTDILQGLPLNNCFVAGGLINLLLFKRPMDNETSDIDLYVPEEKSSLFYILSILDARGDVFYSVNGSVVNVYKRNSRRILQLMSIKNEHYKNIVSAFDMSHVQCAVVYSKDGARKLRISAYALCAFRNMTTSLLNLYNKNLVRFLKAIKRGFDIEFLVNREKISEDVKSDFNNQALIDKYSRDISKYYMPNSEDSDEKALAMIELCSKPNAVVTKDLETVKKNICLGANSFTHELYDITDFRQLNETYINNASLEATTQKYTTRKRITCCGHKYSLMSDKMQLFEIKTLEPDKSYDFVFCVSAEFVQFIKKLEFLTGKNNKKAEIHTELWENKLKIRVYDTLLKKMDYNILDGSYINREFTMLFGINLVHVMNQIAIHIIIDRLNVLNAPGIVV